MPPKFRILVSKIKALFGKQDLDFEFDDEVRAHLLLLTERFVQQGLPPADAAAAARRQFGNMTSLQEDRRETRTLISVETLLQDFRYALRTLWRSRSFAAVSIATLALGIGSATAIFSVIDNVLLEPFPYKDAHRMVFPRIVDTQQRDEGGRAGYTSSEFLELAETNHVFDSVTAASEDIVLYKYPQGTEQFYGADVTPGTLEFFGMPALYGRVLQHTDYLPAAPPVFVMRYKTWIEHFSGDPSLLNKTLVLNGVSRTLVGIMPPRFSWYGADVLIPLTPRREATSSFANATQIWFMLGRLKPGVSTQQAQADLTVIANRLAKTYPLDYPAHFTVQLHKLGDTVVGRFEATLYTVLAAVALLLLIACGNVANLMFARATTREKEFALRAALGAGRARLVRLLMVESLVIACAAAIAGIFLAWGGLQLLVAFMPQDLIPSEAVIQLNAPVLAFALAVALLTALIFGLFPALQSSRRDLIDPIRDSGKGVGGGFRGKWLRDAAVVAEVALSLTLLIGAGLLMRSFVALRDVHLGLLPDHVLQAVLPLPPDRYKTPEQAIGFFRPLLARLQTLPGVLDAAASSAYPIYTFAESKIEIAGKTRQQDSRAMFQHVSQHYFQALRVQFKEGRAFSEPEINDARKVAVVNEAFVRAYLPNENPLGRRVQIASLEAPAGALHGAWLEIIGVVADVKNRYLDPVAPELWLPYTLPGPPVQVLLVRTSQDPATITNAVRQAVWAADSGVPFSDPATLEQRINERLYAGPRFGLVLMAIFGAIGLLLVTLGVYSVLAYSTAQKTREIGIRMALGAARADVLGMVVRTALRLVLSGMAIGIAVSLILGRVLAKQLFGVTFYDPATLAATTLLLTATAALASWIPARRAAQVDPLVALRYE